MFANPCLQNSFIQSTAQMNTTDFVQADVLEALLSQDALYKNLRVDPAVVPFFNKALQNMAIQLICVAAEPKATSKDMRCVIEAIFAPDQVNFAWSVSQRTEQDIHQRAEFAQLWHFVHTAVLKLLTNFHPSITLSIAHMLTWLATEWIVAGADAAYQNTSKTINVQWMKKGLECDSAMFKLSSVQQFVHMLDPA